MSEKKNLSEKKLKKAYITWDENDMESSEDLENEEINLCLMAKSYESDEEFGYLSYNLDFVGTLEEKVVHR